MTNDKTIEAVARAIKGYDNLFASFFTGGELEEIAQAVINAHLEALKEQGLVIVPREATQRMLIDGAIESIVPPAEMSDVWRSMIEALEKENE